MIKKEEEENKNWSAFSGRMRVRPEFVEELKLMAAGQDITAAKVLDKILAKNLKKK